MNIAITVWGNRISPVFDAAKNLLLLDVVDGEIVDRVILQVEYARFDWYLELLQKRDVKLLICGAICKTGLGRFAETGIEVIPFITGEVEMLLDHILHGKEITDFAMPGCRAGDCCRGSRICLTRFGQQPVRELEK